MSAIPIVLVWGLLVWGAVSRKPVLIYLFFASMPFGAFAVVPTALTAGLTITATPLVALMLTLRVFMRRGGLIQILGLACRPDRLLLLFLFGAVAATTTLFMPRLFEGQIDVVPVRGDLDQVVALRPTAQNFSQLVYLLISISLVFAFARLMQSERLRQQAYKALCLGGLIASATGLLDFLSQYLPLGAVLEPLRTASYALAIDVEVLGSKRVVGLMPEASAFGALCLAFLSAIYFYRRAILFAWWRNVVAPVVLVSLLACICVAKSSGTYLGLALFFSVAMLEWLLRVRARDRDYRRGLAGELSAVIGLLIAICTLLIIRPDLLEPVYDTFDRMILQKGSSMSYEQRGMWRSVAFASLFASDGLGVGLGSARTSSSLVAILSGTGIVGAGLYYAFVLQSLARGRPDLSSEGRLVLSAFRFSFVPGFTVGLMVGNSDFGGMTAFGFGLVAAVSGQVPRRQFGKWPVRPWRPAQPA
ncbi:hypothetical protein HT136_02180 [Novosphingobium profundi]|uniref:hypothetical protein n=1 Tax=Novosphingobium profundi TaxID=1774954 RepID=UPI001BDB49B6|nr:hypothetical protein [Novosphingobium profundi]MBT0667175.1 hypothetical protein [Novosphingobium profundi]